MRWLLAAMWLLLGHALHAQEDIAVTGLLDLRGHDWQARPLLDIESTWNFAFSPQLQQLLKPGIEPPHGLEIEPMTSESGFLAKGYYRYDLTVLLDSTAPPVLCLEIPSFLSAYVVSVNDRRLDSVGIVAARREDCRAGARPLRVGIPTAPRVRLSLLGANFVHWHGGLVEPPRLGLPQVVHDHASSTAIIGGILLGLMVMSAAYLLMRYLHRRDKIFLLNALWTLIVAMHFALLHERWLYRLLGDELWWLGYKLELATLFAGCYIGLIFFRVFFGQSSFEWASKAMQWLLLGIIAFVLLAPITWVTQLDRGIPYLLLLLAFVWLALAFNGLRRGKEGALEMSIASVGMLVGIVYDGFFFTQHVSCLHPVHYTFSAFLFTFSWVLSRRAARTDTQVAQLGTDLERANVALANTNKALAAQNDQLEQTVAARTAELVDAQQAAHTLELERRQRDLEALAANNQMKAQLTRNIIAELEQLQQAEGGPAHGLRSVIAGLRQQLGTQERLETLEVGLEQVNNEFYRRLQAHCPQLSKTEREICAYMKLNLTSKDIAQLRQTSLNTINVARHRIRRKLGLERDEELEAFIQQL